MQEGPCLKGKGKEVKKIKKRSTKVVEMCRVTYQAQEIHWFNKK